LEPWEPEKRTTTALPKAQRGARQNNRPTMKNGSAFPNDATGDASFSIPTKAVLLKVVGGLASRSRAIARDHGDHVRSRRSPLARAVSPSHVRLLRRNDKRPGARVGNARSAPNRAPLLASNSGCRIC